jgi:hypothetical protein
VALGAAWSDRAQATMLSRAMELETAKEILAAVFGAGPARWRR